MSVWTEEEKQVIIKNYDSMTSAEIVTLLPRRTKTSVYQRAYLLRLGERMPSRTYWRKCRECGLEAHSNAELELFVKIRRLPFGRDNICKECFNRKYRVGEKLHEAHLKAQRKYDSSPKGREVSKRFRERYQKAYRETNREKIKAQSLARYHIPLGSACEICGSTKNLQRHHPNYSKPLEVMTLCASCHRRVHTNF